jgi:hypothetical protein
MACADVATAKAKTTAIDLIIPFSYVKLQEERFLKYADLVMRLAFRKGSGRKTSATTLVLWTPPDEAKMGTCTDFLWHNLVTITYFDIMRH